MKEWNVVLCGKQESFDENGKKIFRLKEDDINLAVNALSDAYVNKYDKMILISSDRDFIPLIRQVNPPQGKPMGHLPTPRYAKSTNLSCSDFLP